MKVKINIDKAMVFRRAASLCCLVNVMASNLPALSARYTNEEPFLKTLYGWQLPQVAELGGVLLVIPLALLVLIHCTLTKPQKQIGFLLLVLIGTFAFSSTYIESTTWLQTITGNTACTWGGFIPTYIITGCLSTVSVYAALHFDSSL